MDKRLAPAAIEWLQRPVLHPRDFVRGALHGVTSVNRQTRDQIGISIDTVTGTNRFLLTLDSARLLAELILDYLELNAQELRAIAQSASESGSPSVDVSAPDGSKSV